LNLNGIALPAASRRTLEKFGMDLAVMNGKTIAHPAIMFNLGDKGGLP
jgi:hypothetical protein